MNNDGQFDFKSAGLWVTITELAAMKGLGKPAVSERVTRLEAAGLIATRPGKGRAKLINVAAYDHAISQTADLARTTSAATRRGHGANEPKPESEAEPASASSSAVYTREQARHMAYKADMAQLDLDERRGHLIRSDRVTASARESGVVVIEALGGFIHLADDLTAVANREGTHGVRRVIKKAIYEMRVRLADTFAAMAAAAPATDPAGSELPFADPVSVGQMRSEILARAGGGQSEDAPAELSEPR